MLTAICEYSWEFLAIKVQRRMKSEDEPFEVLIIDQEQPGARRNMKPW